MPIRIVQAPAKLNLSLRVLNKLAHKPGPKPLSPGDGGYHNIASLITPIDLCDTIGLRWRSSQPSETAASIDSITKNQGTPVTVVCRCDGVEGQNLAARAAELARFHGEITITKRIPIGAGLGGGSSDAAAVLRALKYSKCDNLSHLLGADVPACFAGRPVWAAGIGDVITPVEAGELPEFSLVVVWPHGQALETAALYRALDAARSAQESAAPTIADAVPAVLFQGSFERLAAHVKNDFEAVAIESVPEIALILRALREAGAAACTITGKGPATFGLFASHDEAARATQQVRTVLGCKFTCIHSRPVV